MARNLKRSLFWAAGLAAIAILIVMFHPGRWSPVLSGEVAVPAISVSPRSMSFTVEAAGTLRATSSRSYGGPPHFGDYWDFQLVSMAPEGRTVRKGDVLLTFDAQRVRDDLQRYQSEFDQATKELEKTKVSIDLERQVLAARLAEAETRFEKLKLKQTDLDNIVASGKIQSDKLELEQAGQEVEALKQRIDWYEKSSAATYQIIQSKQARAQNKVAEIQRGLESFQAKADRDGVVIYNLKWDGQRYQIGETVWSMQSLLEIPDLNTIVVEVLVPEVDIGKISLGQRAEVTIDAFPGKSYSGTVRNVGTLVRPKSWDIPNKILEVQVALDQLDTAVMRPGMSIKARITTSSLDNALAIPIKAVRITDKGASVKVQTASGWIERQVKLGDASAADVIVLSGIEPGERVAADYSKVK